MDIQHFYELSIQDRSTMLFTKLTKKLNPIYRDGNLNQRVNQFMEYDNEKIITALNDNQYFMILLSKMEKQLEAWSKLTDEDQKAYPLWWNLKQTDNKKDGKKGKDEIEDDDPDEVQYEMRDLENEIDDIEQVNVKKQYLVHIIWQKLLHIDPNRTNKLLAKLLSKQITDLKQAIIDKNIFRKLINETYKEIQDGIQKLNPNKIEKDSENKNGIEIKNNNEIEIENSNEKNKEDGVNKEHDSEVEIENENENNNENKQENKDENSETSEENDFDMIPNLGNNLMEIQELLFGKVELNLINKYLVNSWRDSFYSHLKTFQYKNPDFSNKETIYDNSSKSIVTSEDEQFNIKDMVTHLARRAHNKPDDYIILRFNGDSVRQDNGVYDFLLRCGTFLKEIGGIFSLISRRDYVTQRFRINDLEYTEMNKRKKHEREMKEWRIKHNECGGIINHPNHPGPPPQLLATSDMTDWDKIYDRTGSVYSIQVDKNSFRPIKNGVVYWDEPLNLTNSVDLFFQPDAAFTQVEGWKNRMENEFEEWQNNRRDKDIEEDIEIGHEVSLKIFEPKDKCTLLLTIPHMELKDHGDPIDLYWDVLKIFKYFNYQQKLIGNEEIPISKIRTVTRGRKNKHFCDQQFKKWEKWLNNNEDYYYSLNEDQQKGIYDRQYTDQTLTNQVFVQFSTWIDDIPDSIDYVLGKFPMKCITTKLTQLEKRSQSFKQCYSCGAIECADRRCRVYNYTIRKIAKQKGITLVEARKLMGKFCGNCGQTGGHVGHCKMHCKWCGSDNHNSMIHPECPYWNAWGILTLLYNDYFVRNQTNTFGYITSNNDLDPVWKMDRNLVLEKSKQNSKIFNKLNRQLEIIKYLVEKDDFYCSKREQIVHVQKLHKNWKIKDNKIKRTKSVGKCWQCKHDIVNINYKECINKKCETKYCENCWEKCFNNVGTVLCYGCRSICNKHFITKFYEVKEIEDEEDNLEWSDDEDEQENDNNMEFDNENEEDESDDDSEVDIESDDEESESESSDSLDYGKETFKYEFGKNKNKNGKRRRIQNNFSNRKQIKPRKRRKLNENFRIMRKQKQKEKKKRKKAKKKEKKKSEYQELLKEIDRTGVSINKNNNKNGNENNEKRKKIKGKIDTTVKTSKNVNVENEVEEYNNKNNKNILSPSPTPPFHFLNKDKNEKEKDEELDDDDDIDINLSNNNMKKGKLDNENSNEVNENQNRNEIDPAPNIGKVNTDLSGLHGKIQSLRKENMNDINSNVNNNQNIGNNGSLHSNSNFNSNNNNSNNNNNNNSIIDSSNPAFAGIQDQ